MEGAGLHALEGPRRVREHGVSGVRVGGGAHTHGAHTFLSWSLPTLHNLPKSPHLSASQGLSGALGGGGWGWIRGSKQSGRAWDEWCEGGGDAHTHGAHTCLPWSLPALKNLPEFHSQNVR